MLDTNAVSALIRNSGVASLALARELTHRNHCISVITEAEIRFGICRRVLDRRLEAVVERFLSTVDILAWSSACARRYGVLRAALESSGQPLAPMDLMIASHALAEGCTLVTADKAFLRVPELRVMHPGEPSQNAP